MATGNWKNWLRLSPPVTDLSVRVQALEARNAHLETSLQASFDSTTIGNTDDVSSTDKHYTGNPYPSYSAKVRKLTDMYDGRADWGNDTAKNVVDMRAAFLIGAGIEVEKNTNFDGNADRELKFVRDLMEFNNLNQEMPQDMSRMGEIEGKALVRFEIDNTRSFDPWLGMIRMIYVPWTTFNYTVATPSNDPFHYVQATYQGSGPLTTFDLSEPAFVYRRFGGGASRINEPVSKTANILRDLEDLDKTMWDWRKIDHLYASPTPVFSFDSPSVARKFNDGIEYKNWRIGKGVVIAGGTFTLECYTGEGYTTLKDEVAYHVRKISGSTGIPPHFYGFPDLLSNRDTADSLVEGIILSTDKERQTWISFYEEAFRKAMTIYNTVFQNDLNPWAITVRIPGVSSHKMKEINQTWLPMFTAGGLSLETLLRQFTGIDVEDELARIRAQQEEKAKREAAAQSRNAGNGGQPNPGNG